MNFRWLSMVLLTVLVACESMTNKDEALSRELDASNAKLRQQELIDAVQEGHLGKVKGLLAKGYSPNIRNEVGLSPLHYAAVLGNLDIMKLLIEAKAEVSSPNQSRFPGVLHMAAQGGHAEVVQYLLDLGLNIDTPWLLNGHTPLLEATFNARVAVVSMLLKAGADTGAVTLRGLTASDFAARESDRNSDMNDILKLINDHNLNLGLKADEKGKVDITSEQKASRLVALLNIIDPPRRLSEAEVRKRDLQIRLQSAAEKGDLITVRQLVDIDKANLNTRAGRLGTTPLILASVAGKEDVVEYLLANGANPNLYERHPMGISALFKAAVFGHAGIALRLLQAGANVNEQGPANGMSPLHDAVFRGRIEVAKLLLQYGADRSLKDYSGRTPMDFAKGRPELEDLFR